MSQIFLYSALSEIIEHSSVKTYSGVEDISNEVIDQVEVRELIDAVLGGNYIDLELLFQKVKGLESRPRVVIIDESSMVNEAELCLLLRLIDLDSLEHLILVGDERQLPPIGGGKPFVDIIDHLIDNNSGSNYVRLKTNLRFPPTNGIGFLADIFEGSENPFSADITETLERNLDDTLDLQFFADPSDLADRLRDILQKIAGSKASSINDLFTDVFKLGGRFDPERIQIVITKRSRSKFGSDFINVRLVKNGRIAFDPMT